VGLIDPVDLDEAVQVDYHGFFQQAIIFEILLGELSVMDGLLIAASVEIGHCMLVVADSQLFLLV
jgi:hypothetical protein